MTSFFARLFLALVVILSIGIGTARAIGSANHDMLLSFYAIDEVYATAIYLFDVDRQIRIKLVDSSYDPIAMDWSLEGVLAFTSDTHNDIFVLDENGIRNLTNTPEISEDLSVTWSPDGRYLACNVLAANVGGYQIYILDYDNPSLARNVSNNEGRNAFITWSPDGRLLAYRSVLSNNAADSLNIVNPTTGESLYSDIVIRTLNAITWSQDGSQLAFAGEYHFEDGLYLLDTETGDISGVTLPFDSTTVLVNVDWSPQTSWMAIELFDSLIDRNFIYILNLETGELRNISEHAETSGNPSWSLDGQWLVFDAWNASSNDIYILNIETGELRNVTQSSLHESSPVLVP